MTKNAIVADAGAPAPAAGTVAGLIAEVFATLPRPSETEARYLARLRALAERLAAARLQIAVVGQFKRGKSSLLNALLGVSVLPMGVVPLTAITTVLTGGPLDLTCHFLDGRQSGRALSDLESLRAELVSLVTEEGNPANRLGLLRVEVSLPAPLLERGVAFLDTPGIGSTLRHNTEAAIAALPECDMALFVVSPDPPITDAELAYLTQVRANAARIVVVLNKIDTVEPVERGIALRFLRRVLGEAGLSEETPFPLSARAALRAREQGDRAALEASGLPAIERALDALLNTEGPAVLAAAIAGKAAEIVATLQLEAEITARARRLPLAELDQRIAAFDAGIAGLAAARIEASDRIVGDRARLLDLIEQQAARIAEHVAHQLEAAAAEMPGVGEDLAAARQRLAALVPKYFGEATAAANDTILMAITEALHRHQDRVAALINTVRRHAAKVMQIEIEVAEKTELLDLPRLTAWVTDGRTETLARLSTSWIERLLPARQRRAWARRQLMEEAATLTVRNVEALRWSLRQDVSAILGRFADELEAQIAAAVATTRQAMAVARQRQDESAEMISASAAAGEAIAARLGGIAQALRAARQNPPANAPPTEDRPLHTPISRSGIGPAPRQPKKVRHDSQEHPAIQSVDPCGITADNQGSTLMP